MKQINIFSEVTYWQLAGAVVLILGIIAWIIFENKKDAKKELDFISRGGVMRPLK